ncbi:MAG TPA: pyridoxamine 5'-phosphate oxidase family protein [Anaerolineaceae bacterium]|nr:pyridoxamine 5'-phosphate oxidase family protein [Anaerolineaceae bacterium]
MNEDKTAVLDAFLSKPLLLARIATTGKNGQPHVVPVWYLWEDGALWISSFASTRHVRELRADPRCSILIDEAPTGEINYGVIFEGRVELITEPRELVEAMAEKIYTRYLGPVGVKKPDPQSWIYDPENLIIKLTPDWMKVWGI